MNPVVTDALLLDTHAWYWVLEGEHHHFSSSTLMVIDNALARKAVFVSTISAWEIALLVAKNRIEVRKPVREWIRIGLSPDNFLLAAFTPEIAIESNFLPGDLHRDPADRILVATARIMKVRLLTADRTLIEYAGQGHLNVLPA